MTTQSLLPTVMKISLLFQHGMARGNHAILLLIAAVTTTSLAEPAVPRLRVISPAAFSLADFAAQTPRNEAGYFEMELPALVNLSRNEQARGILARQPVVITGQIKSDPATSREPRRLRIVRSIISCCAAHATPHSVSIEFRGQAPAFNDGAWVTLAGKISYRMVDGTALPVVVADEIHAIAEPANPLLR